MTTQANAISVTTSATEIVASNNKRVGLLISNLTNGEVFVGPTNDVTVSNGVLIAAKGNFGDSGKFSWKGSVFGIVNAGTADVRFWEWDE